MVLTELVERMRSFNRFYTESIGSLDERHEGTRLSLAQSRVLYACRTMGSPEVGDIAAALQLDLAYTSRLLGELEDRKLLRRTVAAQDRRRRVVRLTASGGRAIAEVERRSNDRMRGLVAHLDAKQTDELLAAMDSIRRLLGGTKKGT